MVVIPASEAKTKFFELIERAKAGESFLVILDGLGVAALAPLKQRPDKENLEELFARIDNSRKGTVLNPPGADKLTIRQLKHERGR